MTEWTELYNEKFKRRYWKNVASGETSWKDPWKDLATGGDNMIATPNKSASVSNSPSFAESDDGQLWIELFNKKHQRAYWKHKTTGETSWTDPAAKPSITSSSNEVLKGPSSMSTKFDSNSSKKVGASSLTYADESTKSNSKPNNIQRAESLKVLASGDGSTNSDWREHYSEKHQRKYWKNLITDEKSWTAPSSPSLKANKADIDTFSVDFPVDTADKSVAKSSKKSKKSNSKLSSSLPLAESASSKVVATESPSHNIGEDIFEGFKNLLGIGKTNQNTAERRLPQNITLSRTSSARESLIDDVDDSVAINNTTESKKINTSTKIPNERLPLKEAVVTKSLPVLSEMTSVSMPKDLIVKDMEIKSLTEELANLQSLLASASRPPISHRDTATIADKDIEIANLKSANARLKELLDEKEVRITDLEEQGLSLDEKSVRDSERRDGDSQSFKKLNMKIAMLEVEVDSQKKALGAAEKLKAKVASLKESLNEKEERISELEDQVESLEEKSLEAIKKKNGDCQSCKISAMKVAVLEVEVDSQQKALALAEKFKAKVASLKESLNKKEERITELEDQVESLEEKSSVLGKVDRRNGDCCQSCKVSTTKIAMLEAEIDSHKKALGSVKVVADAPNVTISSQIGVHENGHVTKRFLDGSSYEGDVHNGKKHGKGIFREIIKATDGSKVGILAYNGDFQNNKRSGKGYLHISFDNRGSSSKAGAESRISRQANGTSYDGGFLNGKFSGKGMIRYANDDIFDGDFVDGKYSGKGQYRFNSGGKVYIGDVVDGHFCGIGTMTYRNGSVYEGHFANDKFNGTGIFRDAHGNRYEGEFANGMKCGKGVITFTDGFKYEGDFNYDMISGKGKITYKNGSVYQGDVHNGVPDGNGFLLHATGALQSGTFAGGKFVSEGSSKRMSRTPSNSPSSQTTPRTPRRSTSSKTTF